MQARTATDAAGDRCARDGDAGPSVGRGSDNVVRPRAHDQGFDPPTPVIRDDDTKFGRRFDKALVEAGAASPRIPVRAPLLNAYAERSIKSIKQEC